jgi:hypothetical protein
MTYKDGTVIKRYPAVKNVSRVSRVRYERLLKLLKLFKLGKSVKEISEETGYKKNLIYHEMYCLKNHGMLDADFRNSDSIRVVGSLGEMLKKDLKKVSDG